jgi:NADH-quinone oxidoreductase subunit L
VQAGNTFNGPVYTWLTSGDADAGNRLPDRPLTVLMMLVVTFVSLMVHIYTIGYMADDPATSVSSATSRCSPSRC